MSVGEIVSEIDLAQSTVSHHLKILGEVGFALVDRQVTSSWWRLNKQCLACFPSAARGGDGTSAAGRDPVGRSGDGANEVTLNERTRIETEVRDHYAGAAVAARGGSAACCGPQVDQFGAGLYDDLGGVPAAAALASIGCGNPVAVADLHLGETVLDLGSGGGIVCSCQPDGSVRPARRTASTSHPKCSSWRHPAGRRT
jgi:DNA-binding transcriptional ArsR family regulator